MGSSIFKKLGIRLSARDRYEIAFSKGVLLGPAQYSRAATLFEEAASKADADGNEELARRASANRYLYLFLSTGEVGHLGRLSDLLSRMAEIECIGSQSELMPAEPLRLEVLARMVEASIHGNRQERSKGHETAAMAFKKIFDKELLTYQFHSADEMRKKASDRFFFHQGSVDWELAQLWILSDPQKAAAHVARALSCYRQCSIANLAAKAESMWANYDRKRACWICSREFQGEGVHYSHYHASSTPHMKSVLSRAGGDVSGVDVDNQSVVLCRTCSSAVEGMADKIASQRVDQLRAEFVTIFQEQRNALKNHESRILNLEGRRRR